MTTTATAQVPAHLQFDQETENVFELVPDNKYHAVLFIGDVLTLQHKQAALYKLGGRIFPNSVCLPYRFLTRCAITPLQDGMVSVNASLIADNERKNYIQKYTRRNVLLNAATGERGDRVVGAKGSPTQGLLFKKIPAVYEVGAIASQNDGVVHLDFLENGREVVEMQNHYFPDWGRIVQAKGNAFEAFNQTTMKQLREHIHNRKAAAASAKVQRVGDMFLQSCEQYEIWANAYIQTQSRMVDLAKKTSQAVFYYDEIAERIFTFCEITRQDDIIKDFAKNQATAAAGGGKVETAMEMIAQSQQMMAEILRGQQALANDQGIPIGDAKPQGPVAPVPDDALSPEQAYEETIAETVIEAEPTEAQTEAAAATEGSDEIVLEDEDVLTQEETKLGKCADVNSSQEPCGGKVTKKVDGQLYCKYHPKS